MSFVVDSELCNILKPILPLTKAINTSVSASEKHQTIQISQFNNDSQILFWHQINKQKVDKPTKLAVASERLMALLHGRKTKVKLEYDNSALTVSHGKSQVRCETQKFESHERPVIEKDKVLTGLVRKHFNLLSLKTVVLNTECYMFIEEFEKKTQLIVTDTGGYHAVVLEIDVKNKTHNKLTIPLIYVRDAIRILKEDIQICNDESNLYCYTKTDNTVSIIRFRNILDTGGITADILNNAVKADNAFSFRTSSNLFDDILADYKGIIDKERGGVINVELAGKKIILSSETRHGTCKDENKIDREITYKFSLPTSLLEDCLRLKGEVEMGLKQDQNIFYIKQRNKSTGLTVTYILTAERHV